MPELTRMDRVDVERAVSAARDQYGIVEFREGYLVEFNGQVIQVNMQVAEAQTGWRWMAFRGNAVVGDPAVTRDEAVGLLILGTP